MDRTPNLKQRAPGIVNADSPAASDPTEMKAARFIPDPLTRTSIHFSPLMDCLRADAQQQTRTYVNLIALCMDLEVSRTAPTNIQRKGKVKEQHSLTSTVKLLLCDECNQGVVLRIWSHHWNTAFQDVEPGQVLLLLGDSYDVMISLLSFSYLLYVGIAQVHRKPTQTATTASDLKLKVQLQSCDRSRCLILDPVVKSKHIWFHPRAFAVLSFKERQGQKFIAPNPMLQHHCCCTPATAGPSASIGRLTGVMTSRIAEGLYLFSTTFGCQLQVKTDEVMLPSRLYTLTRLQAIPSPIGDKKMLCVISDTLSDAGPVPMWSQEPLLGTQALLWDDSNTETSHSNDVFAFLRASWIGMDLFPLPTTTLLQILQKAWGALEMVLRNTSAHFVRYALKELLSHCQPLLHSPPLFCIQLHSQHQQLQCTYDATHSWIFSGLVDLDWIRQSLLHLHQFVQQERPKCSQLSLDLETELSQGLSKTCERLAFELEKWMCLLRGLAAGQSSSSNETIQGVLWQSKRVLCPESSFCLGRLVSFEILSTEPIG